MMKQVYVITRSYPGIGSSSGGGALTRMKLVDILISKGYKVEVIVPNPNSRQANIPQGITAISFRFFKKWHSFLEIVGLIPDSYINWVKKTVLYLSAKIRQDDIVVCITGGSCDTLDIGYRLKRVLPQIHFIINFQDPINYTLVNNAIVDNRVHHRRDNFEKKVLQMSDMIITSSDFFRQSLQKKYPAISHKVFNKYYGYIKTYQTLPAIFEIENINIVYAGSFNVHQSAESIASLLRDSPRYQIHFIGYYNKALEKKFSFPNVHWHGSMEHDELLLFIANNMHLGFVSLTSDYLAACIPSKIFEYINLGIPIIALLPKGDAIDIINRNNYGRAFYYKDVDNFVAFLNNLTLKDIEYYRENILRDRYKWSMDKLFEDIDKFF